MSLLKLIKRFVDGTYAIYCAGTAFQNLADKPALLKPPETELSFFMEVTYAP